ncbi:serine/threonine-protein kinase [Bifidobacterium vespertilionis]|uniref:serine/threonine-protein kinase n=1 Tax=Bifidobacterium vespertilionis TaxID=2562524 RepID=UPI001BDD3F39|nr:serine/threonine-protein kinase [Bifidobacterium vespertilionis]MBT1178457.1 serine/threonine protein kinase [Bifidobacterium vespertilionis]
MTSYAQSRQPSQQPPHGYELIRRIGGGATADVLLCRPMPPVPSAGPVFGSNPVAVKLSRRQSDRTTAERFRAEAAFLARLSLHPHILTILGSGVTDDGRPFLTLEYAPHGSLRDLMAVRTFSPAQTADLGIRISGALLTAHRTGITHRDIKPSNILVGADGLPRLADFGIAAGVYDGATATGFSTPWAAPEVIAGLTGGSEAADLYALAAVLYAALAGASPYEYGYAPHDEAELERCVLERPLPELKRPDVPPSLARALELTLSKDPERRPFSALEFARQLQRMQGAMGVPVTPLVADGVPALPARMASRAAAVGSASQNRRNRAAHAAARKRGSRGLIVGVIAATVSLLMIIATLAWLAMPRADSVPAPDIVKAPGPQVDEPTPSATLPSDSSSPDPAPAKPAWPDPADIMPDAIPMLPDQEPSQPIPSPDDWPIGGDALSIGLFHPSVPHGPCTAPSAAGVQS